MLCVRSGWKRLFVSEGGQVTLASAYLLFYFERAKNFDVNYPP